MTVFWVVEPCSLVEVYRRFRRPCAFIIRSMIALMMEAARTSETLVTSTRLHGATTQKTAIFVLTAVRTSNPTNFINMSTQNEVVCQLVQTALDSLLPYSLQHKIIQF
jgi:hypothetical protein